MNSHVRDQPFLLHDYQVTAAARGELGIVFRPVFPKPIWDHVGADEIWHYKGATFSETDIGPLLAVVFRKPGLKTWCQERCRIVESGMSEDGNDYFSVVEYPDGERRRIIGRYFKPTGESWIALNKVHEWCSRWDITFKTVSAKRLHSLTVEEIRTAGIGRDEPIGGVPLELRKVWDAVEIARTRAPLRWEFNPWVWIWQVSIEKVDRKTLREWKNPDEDLHTGWKKSEAA